MVDKFKADVGDKRFTVKAKTAQDGTVTLRAKRDGVRGINFSSVQNRMKEELKKEVDKAGEDAKGLKKAGARIKGFFKGAKKVLQHSANKRLGQIKSEDMDVISATRATVSRTASAEKELEKKGFTREDLPREDILNTLLKSEPNAGASVQDQLHADVNSVIQNFAEMTYGKKVAGQLNPEADFTDMKTLEGRAAIVKEDIENQKKAAAEARKVKAEKFAKDIKDAAPDIINTYFHEFDHFWNNDGKLNGELQERIEGKLRKLGAESKECTADHKFAFNKPEIRAEMLAPILDRLEKANNAKLPGLKERNAAFRVLKNTLTPEAQAEIQEKINAEIEKFKHNENNINNYKKPKKPVTTNKNSFKQFVDKIIKSSAFKKTAGKAPEPGKSEEGDLSKRSNLETPFNGSPLSAENVKTQSGNHDGPPVRRNRPSEFYRYSESASNLPARHKLDASPFDTDADSEIRRASPRASASSRYVPFEADNRKQSSPQASAASGAMVGGSTRPERSPDMRVPAGRARAQQPVVPPLAVLDPLSPSHSITSVKSDSSLLPLPGDTYQTDVSDTNTQFIRSLLYPAGNVNPAIDNASGDSARSASIKGAENTYTPLHNLDDTGSASVFDISAATSPEDESKKNS